MNYRFNEDPFTPSLRLEVLHGTTDIGKGMTHLQQLSNGVPFALINEIPIVRFGWLPGSHCLIRNSEVSVREVAECFAGVGVEEEKEEEEEGVKGCDNWLTVIRVRAILALPNDV